MTSVVTTIRGASGLWKGETGWCTVVRKSKLMLASPKAWAAAGGGGTRLKSWHVWVEWAGLWQTSSNPLGDSDRPNFRAHPVKGDFSFHEHRGCKEQSLCETRVKRGQKASKSVVSLFVWIRGSSSVFFVSLLQIRVDCLQITGAVHLLWAFLQLLMASVVPSQDK